MSDARSMILVVVILLAVALLFLGSLVPGAIRDDKGEEVPIKDGTLNIYEEDGSLDIDSLKKCSPVWVEVLGGRLGQAPEWLEGPLVKSERLELEERLVKLRGLLEELQRQELEKLLKRFEKRLENSERQELKDRLEELEKLKELLEELLKSD